MSNGTPEDALQVMSNTGPAYLDSTGAMVDSGEYVAALYESYAADHEYVDAITRYGSGYNETHKVMARYAHTAGNVAEDLWTRDLESLTGEEY